MARKIPPPPLMFPVVDEKTGTLSQPWAAWMKDIFILVNLLSTTIDPP